jgi:hypothetical protein
MADTLGSVIDKLITIDMKLWNNQELLYKIRRMSFDQFREEYINSDEKIYALWISLQKTCDLNVQRNQLIDEVDLKIVEMFGAMKNGENLDDGKFIQRKHKTL